MELTLEEKRTLRDALVRHRQICTDHLGPEGAVKRTRYPKMGAELQREIQRTDRLLEGLTGEPYIETDD